MNTAYLLVDSVTYAIKARKVLSAIGIRSSLKKITVHEMRGCKYAVYTERRHYFSAMAALRQSNIPFEEWRGG